MGTELPPWPHAAAATETRVRFCGEETITTKQNGQPSRSVRIHGELILSHGTRRITGSSVDVTHKVAVELDHRVHVRPAPFTCIGNCSNLIHNMLATAPATVGYDLAAAGNWVDSTRTPLDIARALLWTAWHDYGGAPTPSGLEFDVHLPELQVTLVYSEPKALLLACKEDAAKTQAAAALARGRKRRRRETAGELCAICFSDVETREEETVGLPCSHSFHSRCIEPWFHHASTCPTCRLDIMDCFRSVKAAPPEHFIHVGDGFAEELNGIPTLFDI